MTAMDVYWGWNTVQWTTASIFMSSFWLLVAIPWAAQSVYNRCIRAIVVICIATDIGILVHLGFWDRW